MSYVISVDFKSNASPEPLALLMQDTFNQNGIAGHYEFKRKSDTELNVRFFRPAAEDIEYISKRLEKNDVITDSELMAAAGKQLLAELLEYDSAHELLPIVENFRAGDFSVEGIEHLHKALSELSEDVGITHQKDNVKEGEIPDTKSSSAIFIDLKIFDDVGNHTDVKATRLTHEQIADILNHASQLVTVIRDGQDGKGVLAALEEALVAANVIDAISNEQSYLDAEQMAGSKGSWSLVEGNEAKDYVGSILGSTAQHVVQSLGKTAVIHHKHNLDRAPEKGEMLTISYDGSGRGGVEPKAQDRGVSR